MKRRPAETYPVGHPLNPVVERVPRGYVQAPRREDQGFPRFVEETKQ